MDDEVKQISTSQREEEYQQTHVEEKETEF